MTGSSHPGTTTLVDRRWRLDRPAVWLVVALIRCYQIVLRPHLAGSCKFCPTCSQYAMEALLSHGLVRGSVLAVRRLARCHPFSPGGIDPVP
ncbi:MAG: membrane protein insertion efficiency factor YidD [Planctomycetota bacterium]